MPKLLRRGEPFGTVGFGCPYYKAGYDFFRWWTWLLIDGFEPGDQCLNSANVQCEVPIPLAHNRLVAEFLRGDRDTLLLIEDDHVGPQDVIRKMRQKEENWDFDIVCASYTNRRHGSVATGFMLGDGGRPNEYGEYLCQMNQMDVWESGTQPVDGAALGAVLIRRWVLEAMRGERELEETFWFDWRGRNSQDVNFYGKTHALGARVGVDRDNDVGHIGQHIYTMREFYHARQQFINNRGGIKWRINSLATTLLSNLARMTSAVRRGR
jgi:hypothetical protein